MKGTANPEMLTLARESRGLTQKSVAESLGVTQGLVSKCESGLLEASEEYLKKLSDLLRYPTEFFQRADRVYGFGSICVYHRKRASVSARDLKAIHAKVNILRMQAEKLLQGVEIESENGFPSLDIDEYGGSPERIAQIVKTHWNLPLGPVRSLIKAIEDAGGIVFHWDFNTQKIDAVSQWPAGSPPLFFVNTRIPADRWRYSLAHELGHVIMHARPTPDDTESQADRFAAEFLMPERAIAQDLSGFSLEKAAALKPYWRVSMAALIRRARDLGKITPRKYESLFTQMGCLGYRTHEPAPIQQEEPTLLRSVVEVHLKEHGYSVAELSSVLTMQEQEFRDIYLPGQTSSFRVVG